MRAMILLAHGSRKKESADEVKSVAEEIEKDAIQKGQFDIVKPAFMQFCKPDFYQVIEEIVENIKSKTDSSTKNSIEVVILPYFISAGSHVSEDIPALLNEASLKYPNIVFTVTPHLGKFQGLKELILDRTA
ncbi:MAG: CbiX/SirB N-terminal domain-containing protein [Desulfamplus sp.]|nr:CbiX/SirB N-terminal domain-containing protein [Desulfamplus sp.]